MVYQLMKEYSYRYDIKKQIVKMEKNRMQSLKTFNDNVIKYGEYIVTLQNNKKELDENIRLANVQATLQKVQKQTVLLYLNLF